MQIIDGYCNEPNIFADDIGEYNTAIWGTRDCVLPAGERLGYELVSNNEIKIKDGVFSTQGRRGVIKKGTTESCIIENGTQAENRNDLIVIEYAKDSSTLVESHTLKVIKGTPGEAATDPDVVTGDIQAGDVLHQMPLYRVKLEGLNVVAVERLFSVGNNAIGKEFDPDKDYEIGDLTLQYNKAWKFKVKHLAGAWDESQMEETDVLTELAEQNKNFEALNEKMQNQKITHAIKYMPSTSAIPNGGKIMEMTVPQSATYLVNVFPRSAGIWLGINGSAIVDQNSPFYFNCAGGSSSAKVMSLEKDTVLSLWNLNGATFTYDVASFIELIRIGS